VNVLFMGTPDFAVPSLRALIASRHTVTAVATGEDKPRGRGRALSPTPVKAVALEAGIPVIETGSVRDPQFAERLREHPADVFVVVAFRILPPAVFTMPTQGTFNLHASLLPRYRGAAPINWALINGDARSGVTTFFIRETVDTGSVILQRSIDVPESMTAGELHDALADLGAGAVTDTVDMIEAGKVVPAVQDDTLATPAPKLFRETCRIPWEKSARDVHNFIRGLCPHPGAWTMHGDHLLKLHRTRTALLQRNGVPQPLPSGVMPGTVLRDGEHLGVFCGEHIVDILELQQEGRRVMSAAEFLRGYPLQNGDMLA
jgi:methionyl-tRNA formyltransferase